MNLLNKLKNLGNNATKLGLASVVAGCAANKTVENTHSGEFLEGTKLKHQNYEIIVDGADADLIRINGRLYATFHEDGIDYLIDYPDSVSLQRRDFNKDGLPDAKVQFKDGKRTDHWYGNLETVREFTY